MIAARLALVALLAALLVAHALAAPHAHTRTRLRRQLADDNALQPLDDDSGDDQTREKRKLEGVTQAKFGIKNAVLGFVFGSGATWRLPTALRPRPEPRTPRSSLSTQNTSTSTSRSGSVVRTARQAMVKPTDDIPVFDRNKVSLDFPGSLFGPSVSLLIRTTKIIGEVVQNSAVRYQSFLRLFRPLFRGQFEIKGLDPLTTTTTRRPTTTTTTTTTSAAPATADNEIRRKR